MTVEKNYLTDILKMSGVKSHVYGSMKKLRAAAELHLAAVLPVKESFVRAKQKTRYQDDDGNSIIRKKLFDRKTVIRVIIADTTDEKVDEILTEFMKNIGTGCIDDKNFVGMEIENVDWVDEQDSILKAKCAVQFDVVCTAGIYKDTATKKAVLGDISAERR